MLRIRSPLARPQATSDTRIERMILPSTKLKRGLYYVMWTFVAVNFGCQFLETSQANHCLVLSFTCRSFTVKPIRAIDIQGRITEASTLRSTRTVQLDHHSNYLRHYPPDLTPLFGIFKIKRGGIDLPLDNLHV